LNTIKNELKNEEKVMGFLNRLFKKEKSQDKAKLIKAHANAKNIVSDYGDFMGSDKFPHHLDIADTNELPHKKDIIKSAITILIIVEKDEKMKEFLKTAYLTLSSFQDNVGSNHIKIGSSIEDMEKMSKFVKGRNNLTDNEIASMKLLMKTTIDEAEKGLKYKKIISEERAQLIKDIEKL
jgi:hypothetical protein